MSLSVETTIKKARVVQSGDRLDIQVWSRFGWTVDSAYRLETIGQKQMVNTLALTRLMLLIEHGYSLAEYKIG